MELEEKTGLTINIFDDGSNPEARDSRRSGVSDSFFDYVAHIHLYIIIPSFENKK